MRSSIVHHTQFGGNSGDAKVKVKPRSILEGNTVLAVLIIELFSRNYLKLCLLVKNVS